METRAKLMFVHVGPLGSGYKPGSNIPYGGLYRDHIGSLSKGYEAFYKAF